MADDGADNPLLTIDPIVEEARKRFDLCNEWESEWRAKYVHDVKFANGDSQNGWQWPNEIRTMRQTAARPCLTMNLIKPHNRMISNAARKNKSSVKYIGTGNGATQEMANVYQDLHRYVEYQSQAQSAYTVAREFQIDGGIGYWRIATQYADAESWDVEPTILPIEDPLSVFLDRDRSRMDGLDARYGFVFDDVDKDDFDQTYPEVAELVGHQPLGIGTTYSDWLTKNRIRLVEYFRKVPVRKSIMSFVHRGERFTISHDRLEKLVLDREARDRIVEDPSTRHKDVWDDKVEWFLIAGERIVDRTDWPGKYIPIIPCVGEVTKIDGRVDYKGHTRAMLDAQRMFNYNASAQVEYGALGTKAQWLAPIKSIEEFEVIWRMANITAPPVLPYKHADPDHPDVPLPPPQRIDPPKVSEAFQAGMENAKQQFMMVTGQYENSSGEQGNERTGAAINSRKRQGDTATYHFQDNYETALIASGKQLLDLFPRLIDTKRVMRIIGDSGMEYDLEMNPGLAQGYLEQKAHDGKIVRKAMNPLVGKFDIAAKVGPSYDSSQEETAEALTLILTQAPNLIPILGDLLVKNLPFEGSQEAALRLRRMIPPQALGDGPSQSEQQLQAQVQALQTELTKLFNKNAADKLKLLGKDQLRDIEAYRAETERFKALQDALEANDPEGLRQVVEKLVQESMATNVAQIPAENASGEAEQGGGDPSMPPGAGVAPDGEHYMPHPEMPGQFLKVKERPPFEGARQGKDGEFYVPLAGGKWAKATKKASGVTRGR